MELKFFVDTMAITDQLFKIDEHEWQKIDNLCVTMKCCYCFTKKTQAEQMTMSDFYVEWVAIKLSLDKRVECDFATKLGQCMIDREKDLFQNQTLLAALFLDARFRVFLKDKPLNKHTAITHLGRIWKRLQDLKPTVANETESSNENDDTIQNHNDCDELDSLLTTLDRLICVYHRRHVSTLCQCHKNLMLK